MALVPDSSLDIYDHMGGILHHACRYNGLCILGVFEPSRMSLTLERLHRLRGKGFEKLYTDHEIKWKEMVSNAKDYAKTFIKEGERIRPGDVAEILQNALRVDPHFEAYIKAKGLQQKYWVVYFADYILDQVFPPVEII
jgi:hypothetical protein